MFLFLTDPALAQVNLASAHYSPPKVSGQEHERLEVHLEGAKVKELLDLIEQQTNRRFVYDKSVLEYEATFNIQEKQIELKQLLQKVSRESHLRFKLINNNINVRLVPHSLQVASNNNEIAVTGTVVDESGNPLPGVSVLIKGTSTGTVTDVDGSFALEVSGDDILVFSYMGFLTQEVPVGDRTVFSIT